MCPFDHHMKSIADRVTKGQFYEVATCMYQESRSAHTVNSKNMYLSLSLEYERGMAIDLIHCIKEKKNTCQKWIPINLNVHWVVGLLLLEILR